MEKPRKMEFQYGWQESLNYFYFSYGMLMLDNEIISTWIFIQRYCQWWKIAEHFFQKRLIKVKDLSFNNPPLRYIYICKMRENIFIIIFHFPFISFIMFVFAWVNIHYILIIFVRISNFQFRLCLCTTHSTSCTEWYTILQLKAINFSFDASFSPFPNCFCL